MPGRGVPKSEPTNSHQVPSTVIQPGVQPTIAGHIAIIEDPRLIRSRHGHRKTPKRSRWSKI